jgi:DNA-binding MarR family transcriptional regulator
VAICRHCEERSDEAIQGGAKLDCFASLAMTNVNNKVAHLQTFATLQSMIGGSTPEALAARFTAVAHLWVADGPAERLERARRQLLSAIAAGEPLTLNEVAKTVRRGAPAVSRSVDSLVRAGLVERTQDPDNRRRLALRLTEEGRERLASRTAASSNLRTKFERLAHSELRAVERAIEILERGL